MPRTPLLILCWLAFVCLIGAQQKASPEPPEEDESLAPKEYAFNPLQAEKELKVGNFYFKRGNYKAAAIRYEEATKWNNGWAEAWLKLGETREKLRQKAEAQKAYRKYLELEPDGKDAARLKKKLGNKS